MASSQTEPSHSAEHAKEELFKPVETKDQDELTLENLRASKLNQNSSLDDVRAPGILQRVKEEVDAIVESIKEEHQNDQSPRNRVGCFSWFGFGGFNKHHQSQ